MSRKSVVNGSSSNEMIELIMGANKSCVIHCAAKLNIVDHLFDNPMTADQLSIITETQPEMLYRLLRALASIGVLRENNQNQFLVTNLGLTLKDGIEGGMKYIALDMLGPKYIANGYLDYTIRTGQPAFEHVFGTSNFDYLKSKPELGVINAKSMKEWNEISLTSLLITGYDFKPYKHIVDVGGGIGDFLVDILEQNQKLSATLFDVKNIAQLAKEETVKNDKVKDRCTVVSGSFFDFVPSGGDCYIAKGVIHEWNDELAFKILANIRKQMSEDCKLLVIEAIQPEDGEPNPNAISDLLMSTISSGKERNKEEYFKLFYRASLRLNKIFSVYMCGIQIMELVPL